MKLFKKFQAYLKLEKAIRMADKAHAADGHRYYVLPVLDSPKHDLIVMNRALFRKYKQKGHIATNVYVSDIIYECFYHTPYANGDRRIHPDVAKAKRKGYYMWVLGK